MSRRWVIVIVIMLLVAGGFGVYWFATADARACDDFRTAVREAAKEAIGEKGEADKELFDSTVRTYLMTDLDVWVDGEKVERPEGCGPPQ